MGKVYLLAIAVFMLSLNLNAEIPVHSERVYQQGVHQHGLAVITLALEGDQIDVELESPLQIFWDLNMLRQRLSI